MAGKNKKKSSGRTVKTAKNSSATKVTAPLRPPTSYLRQSYFNRFYIQAVDEDFLNMTFCVDGGYEDRFTICVSIEEMMKNLMNMTRYMEEGFDPEVDYQMYSVKMTPKGEIDFAGKLRLCVADGAGLLDFTSLSFPYFQDGKATELNILGIATLRSSEQAHFSFVYHFLEVMNDR